MKRTHIDYSKHEVLVTESDGLLIHCLKQPDTYTHYIKFINTNNIMAVTGDFGNWIFCREFHPSVEGSVSDGYWIEKLQISSCQDPYKYSPEITTEKINQRLSDLEGDGWDGEKLEKIKDYYEDCLSQVDDEIDYLTTARDMPNFLDYESIIVGKELSFWLRAIFDGFEEICSRMKQVTPTT